MMTRASPGSTHWWLAALALAVITVAYLVRIRTDMADFAVNVRAGQRVLAGESLYQTADGHWMFKYLPPSALVYAPLAKLPFEAAKGIWFVLSLIALVGSFVIAASLGQTVVSRGVLVVAGLILAKYILRELSLGQINLLVMLPMLASLDQLSRRDDRLGDAKAGALTGLSIALKPYAALLLAWLIVTRRWRSALAACVTLAVLLVLPAFVYGFEGNLHLLREWAMTLGQSTPGLLTSNDNVSVVALFTKWLGDPRRAVLPTAIVLGVLAVMTLAVVTMGRRQPRSFVLEGALVLTLIPLVSPLGWDYTFVLALLAVILILGHWSTFAPWARVLLGVNFAIVALVVFDLMGRESYGRFMQWSVTTLNFLVIVSALSYLRFRRTC